MCERQSGDFAAAVRLLRRALLIEPLSPEAHCELGLALQAAQQLDEALTCFDKLITLKPDLAEAHYNRGNALLQLGKFEQCIASYNNALALRPTHVSALINRGTTLLQLKQAQQALNDFDAALALSPGQVVAWTNRAEALRVLQHIQDALASCDRALSISPDNAHAWLVRAGIMKDAGLQTEALAACQRALEISPNFPEALTRLGERLALQGDVEGAVSCFDRALAIKPDDDITLSTRIFALDFAAKGDFASHQAARSLWWHRIGAKIAAEHPPHHDNDFNPTRRIVLGYVSADFKHHSAAYAFRPVLQHHDRSQFEVICYSGSPVEDAVTASFRQLADRWRDARMWSDDQLAQCIATDKVDILIDLSGHSERTSPARVCRQARADPGHRMGTCDRHRRAYDRLPVGRSGHDPRRGPPSVRRADP